MKFSNWQSTGCLATLVLTVLSVPTAAQQQGQPQQPLGQVAGSTVGKVGQRQTREQTQTNIEPMKRINNRIANRVQSRIRNRIDRHYNPQPNVTSPFEVAAEQERRAGTPTSR